MSFELNVILVLKMSLIIRVLKKKGKDRVVKYDNNELFLGISNGRGRCNIE